MIKKIQLILIFYFFFINLLNNDLYANINIKIKVNDEIITNIDIEKEYNYLVALNKELSTIPRKEILQLARESLIREKIKKFKILEFFELGMENDYVEKIMKDLYLGLGVKNKLDFEIYLTEFNLTIEDVKSKLEIETLWNDLIYNTYKNQIKINRQKIEEELKIKLQNQNTVDNFLLNEIAFNALDNQSLKDNLKKIEESIAEIGFKNTASIYSQSSSAKFKGNLGWLAENQLSKSIVNEIIQLKVGEHTKPIPISGGFLILNLENKKQEKQEINFDKELERLITYERNIQLNQYSKILYNKLKQNAVIDEN